MLIISKIYYNFPLTSKTKKLLCLNTPIFTTFFSFANVIHFKEFFLLNSRKNIAQNMFLFIHIIFLFQLEVECSGQIFENEFPRESRVYSSRHQPDSVKRNPRIRGAGRLG